jgi:1,4-dihydroxy-2-naphthoate octaprenyltransferase
MYYEIRHAYALLAALSPIVTYFAYWFWRVWKDPAQADFRQTMRLNFLSATCLSAYFTWLLFDTRNVGRYLFD